MGIGIDAEPNLPLPDRIVGRIASPREIERVTALRRQRPDVCADRLLFSAKESVYKVWYPRERTMLDFHQAEIDLRPDGRFSAVISPHVARRLAGRRAPEKMTGHWDLDRGVLRTSVAVLAGETPAPESRTTSFDRGSTHDHHRD